MSEDLEKIAEFMEKNRITIQPDRDSVYEKYGFWQYKDNGELRKVGELKYDRVHGSVTVQNGSKEVPDMCLKVLEPLKPLLEEAKGDLYGIAFQEILDALDRIEDENL